MKYLSLMYRRMPACCLSAQLAVHQFFISNIRNCSTRCMLPVFFCFVLNALGASAVGLRPSTELLGSIFEKDSASLLLKLMHTNDGFFSDYIDSSASFEIQIIYTQIDRDKKNKPTFKQFSYRLNDNVYFCPASTSKLPVTLISLEKLNKLGARNVSRNTAMQFDSAAPCQAFYFKDTIATDSVISVEHCVEKIMLVSDNESYNRLYEFLGQQPLNERLWKMGFKKTSIIQRFNNCNAEDNRSTNPMRFIGTNGQVLYSQPLVRNSIKYQNPLGTVLKGTGYMTSEGVLVPQPRDFTFYNNMPLQDLHDIFMRTIFYKSFPKRQRFNIQENDYPFLYKYMGLLPRESEFPKYRDTAVYKDNRKKYLMFGTDSFKTIVADSVRVLNIVGQMGGYLTDCAYVIDFKNKIEFVVAATIYCNQSGVFYVPNYRYKQKGFPFLQNLGQLLYHYELERPRKYKPDLSSFEMLFNKK